MHVALAVIDRRAERFGVGREVARIELAGGHCVVDHWRSRVQVDGRSHQRGGLRRQV
ncbi:hypothetical protein D3C81_1138670 [compost metagenome]